MNWPYVYTPDIWPMLASAAFMFALALYAWRHRSTRGAAPLAVTFANTALWAFTGAAVVASANFPTQLFWFVIFDAVSLAATVFPLFFVLEYSGLGKWVTRRNVALLLIPAVLDLLLGASSEYRGLMFARIWYEGGIRYEMGPANVLLSLYGLALAVLAPLILIALFVRSPVHRWPVGLILVGMLAPRVVYSVTLSQGTSSSSFLATVVAFDFTAVLYMIALFHFRLFGVVPVGRETAVERMANGVLVLDAENRIVDMNPAASRVLALERRGTIGRAAVERLAAYPEIVRLLMQETATSAELALGGQDAPRFFQVQVSLLTDPSGSRLGQLVLLQDVTEQRRARELVLEQQRALAVLQERERLARELHDSAGQVLAYVSMQAQAIRKYVHDGQGTVAEAQLTCLAEAAREAHTDLREAILNLKVGSGQTWEFFTVLKQYLDTFADHYGICTELAIPPGIGKETIEPVAGIQLLRVIQEALTNARKHGQARRVEVRFKRQDGQVQIIVADDGCGFNPDRPLDLEHDHFGLTFMRERMAAIGGTVTIHSQPGTGAQVVLTAPLRDP